jgi:hypothetical protein
MWNSNTAGLNGVCRDILKYVAPMIQISDHEREEVFFRGWSVIQKKREESKRALDHWHGCGCVE